MLKFQQNKIIIFLGIIVAILFLPKISLAAVYYVSPTGSASWSQCVNIDTPCSLNIANQNAIAGDMVYLKKGIYLYTKLYAEALSPKNSGTISGWIVFKNAPGETPEIKSTYGTRMWGLLIEGKSYIQIDGIIFTDFSDYLIRNSAHHIEVKNSTFINITSPYRRGGFQMVEVCAGGGDYRCYVSDIWIHHNTFYQLAGGGGCSGGIVSEGGDAVRVGYPKGTCGVGCTTGANHHITIEDNYMAYAGHAFMDTYGTNQVIKNNVAHNEPWYPADNGTCIVNHLPTYYTNPAYTGLYSHRVWQISDDFQRDGVFNLIEGNRLGYAGINPNNDGATSLTIASSRNIVRYNATYGSMNNSMKTKYGSSGGGSIGGLNNRIYNNTLYKNGYGYTFFQTCTGQQLSTCPKPLVGFRWYYPHDNPGNVLVNNIVYGSYGAVEKGYEDIRDNTSGSMAINNWCTNNDAEKCNVYGDPLFVNPDLTQTTSRTLPNLNLQSSSGAINSGAYLTQVSGSGNNSIELIVDDASYFQDGTWGASMAKGVTLFPDWIAIGSVNNTVQINSINYSTNTITLISPMTWSDNANIWLYKNSSGNVVLSGLAPDIGAYEYVEAAPPPDTTPPAPPTNLTIQ